MTFFYSNLDLKRQAKRQKPWVILAKKIRWIRARMSIQSLFRLPTRFWFRRVRYDQFIKIRFKELLCPVTSEYPLYLVFLTRYFISRETKAILQTNSKRNNAIHCSGADLGTAWQCMTYFLYFKECHAFSPPHSTKMHTRYRIAFLRHVHSVLDRSGRIRMVVELSAAI